MMTFFDFALLLSVLMCAFFTAGVMRMRYLGCSLIFSFSMGMMLLLWTMKMAYTLYVSAFARIRFHKMGVIKAMITPFFLLNQVLKLIPAVNEMVSHDLYEVYKNAESANKTSNENKINKLKEDFLSKVEFA